MKIVVACSCALVALVLLTGFGNSTSPRPDADTKEVMGVAMKGGLCKKVASGKADADEKKLLVKLFTKLAASKPPVADDDDWKSKTKALLDAAKAIEKGDDAAGKLLAKAANCAACHKAHKG
jgi:hypothetical protein